MPVSKRRIVPYWVSGDGYITLYCADALDVMPTLRVDAVLADPPYNSNLNYNSYKDNLPSEDYWAWMRKLIELSCLAANNLVVIKHSSLKVIEWGKYIGSGRLVIWYKPFSSGYPVNGFATHFEPLWVMKGKAIEWSKDVVVCSAGNSHKDVASGLSG